VGDLNGDGKPDLVTANNVDNTISVLLGNGGGRISLAEVAFTTIFARSAASSR
jgi:hypothetical protein